MIVRIVLALFCLAVAAPAALPPKATDFAGTVVAVTPQTITVQGKIGPRLFHLYPGTIFGKGNRQKLADFKPGSYVIVVFSEAFGTSKAENIRSEAAPKPKIAPKPSSTVGKAHSRR